MDAVDAKPELSESEIKREADTNQINRLRNWVNERPVIGLERRVRSRIANAIITDILDPVDHGNVPHNLETYRQHVDNAVQIGTQRLKGLPANENGVIIKSADRTDKLTGRVFYTQVRNENERFISEELGANGEVISRSDIRGQEITLNYSDARYQEKGADPKIFDKPGFPTGTKVLFLNHLASLGIITWRGK